MFVFRSKGENDWQTCMFFSLNQSLDYSYLSSDPLKGLNSCSLTPENVTTQQFYNVANTCIIMHALYFWSLFSFSRIWKYTLMSIPFFHSAKRRSQRAENKRKLYNFIKRRVVCSQVLLYQEGKCEQTCQRWQVCLIFCPNAVSSNAYK